MARPRVFVSSTFYDLKHIRASLEVFIESLGFDAILFEKGDISWHPDMPLDESCYREAASADIFVLVIGGRYGSAASSQADEEKSEKLNVYESITKKEFDTAQENDIPTFILVENAVASEYRTYQKNRDNPSVVYAHVDSDGVFKLLESIFEKSKNNPVFNFDKATQIESWLREQWSGLFRELLRARSQQRQLSALNFQVTELKSVNETLKKYLEEVLQTVKPDQSEKIIADEDEKLKKLRSEINLENNKFYRYLVNQNLDHDAIVRIIAEPKDADEAIELLDTLQSANSIVRRHPAAQSDYNKAREFLEVQPIDFNQSSYQDAVDTANNIRRAPGTVAKSVGKPLRVLKKSRTDSSENTE